MSHGIYWLASYPKSGNTWTRALITNYLVNSDEPADINALQTDGIASNRETFDDLLCLPSSDMSEEQIRLFQPRLYEELMAHATRDYYIKVHDAYTLNSVGEPLFPALVTKGVIYILRNPMDVAVSYAAHGGKDISKTYANINKESFTIALSEKTLADQLPQRLLDWSSHVRSWIDSPLRVHVMRYEDMLSHPYETFQEMLEFMGFEIDPDRLTKAVRFSSFEELKKQEEAKSFREKPTKSKSFFRSGKTGGYKDILTSEQIDKITSAHREIMGKFGY
ncbi:MAG: sulfotransferase domain-containing protein [Pseudomonadota bacterium]